MRFIGQKNKNYDALFTLITYCLLYILQLGANYKLTIYDDPLLSLISRVSGTEKCIFRLQIIINNSKSKDGKTHYFTTF